MSETVISQGKFHRFFKCNFLSPRCSVTLIFHTNDVPLKYFYKFLPLLTTFYTISTNFSQPLPTFTNCTNIITFYQFLPSFILLLSTFINFYQLYPPPTNFYYLLPIFTNFYTIFSNFFLPSTIFY